MKPAPPVTSDQFAAILFGGCRLVITDSGGVTEEASILGVPCVQARTVTDRPECCTAANADGQYRGGGSVLGGNTTESISKAIQVALTIPRERINRDIYGDGTASKQISEWLASIVQ